MVKWVGHGGTNSSRQCDGGSRERRDKKNHCESATMEAAREKKFDAMLWCGGQQRAIRWWMSTGIVAADRKFR